MKIFRVFRGNVKKCYAVFEGRVYSLWEDPITTLKKYGLGEYTLGPRVEIDVDELLEVHKVGGLKITTPYDPEEVWGCFVFVCCWKRLYLLIAVWL